VLLAGEEQYPWAVAGCLRKFVRGRAEVVCGCVWAWAEADGGCSGGAVGGRGQTRRTGGVWVVWSG